MLAYFLTNTTDALKQALQSVNPNGPPPTDQQVADLNAQITTALNNTFQIDGGDGVPVDPVSGAEIKVISDVLAANGISQDSINAFINVYYSKSLGIQQQIATNNKTSFDIGLGIVALGVDAVPVAGYAAYKLQTLLGNTEIVAGDTSKIVADTTNATAVASNAEAWTLNATDRGIAIENNLANTEYQGWYHVGAEDNGYFKVIDFQQGNNVVSLKTIDPTLPSYSGNGATTQIITYLNDLDVPITVDGQLANKVLDIRIPPSTSNMLDMNQLLKAAADRGITLTVKEF